MTDRRLLPADEVSVWLAGHPLWSREGDEIVSVRELPSFPAAIEFVRRVAVLAEEHDHHPDIDVRWRTVRLALTTHSSGGLTPMDLGLADAIDAA
jgi:4a-hydroxytetrahydrobiopterin dehydratase